MERNKKKSVATFFREFSDEENKKSKQIGQEKVALTITGAGVVARKLTFSNNISELLDGAPAASASMAFPLHHCHKSCRWLVANSAS